jgi:dipeptidyl aminopeptidase/acylaminoacyl peptidase
MAWTYEAVRWIDDNSLIIGSFAVRPFDGEVTEAPFPISDTAFYGNLEFAPDWSRVYGFIVPGQRDAGIFDPEALDDVIKYVDVDEVAWKYDSSGFIGEQYAETGEELSLFNRDGEFIERLYASEGGRIDIRRTVAGRNELGWSPDNHYFAFVDDPPYPQDSQLILLDMENHIAVNTCLSPVSQSVWSPDGKQVAMLLPARDNLKVVILDVDTWTAYDVARHSGIRGALSPDMIAWRSND